MDRDRGIGREKGFAAMRMDRSELGASAWDEERRARRARRTRRSRESARERERQSEREPGQADTETDAKGGES